MTIDEKNNYEIGVLKPGKQKEYPEFARGKHRALFGSQIVESGCTTWEEFFEKNPLRLSPGIWHVYKVSGKSLTWMIQGEPSQKDIPAPGLGDTITPEENPDALPKGVTRTDYRKLQDELAERNRELSKLKDAYREDITNVREGMQERINSLTIENKVMREEKEKLQGKYEEQFETRIELTQQISDLKHQIEKKESEHSRQVQTLRDDISKEDKTSMALAEIISYYEKKNTSVLKDLMVDTLKDAKPYVGAVMDGLVEMFKERFGKKGETPQIYEG